MGAVFHSSNAHYFGYQGAKVNSDSIYSYMLEYTGTTATKWNISVALNMLPVIGNIIAGIMHIVQGLSGTETDKSLIARGLVECTVVGGLALAAADIVVTVGRMVTDDPADQEGVY